MRNVAITILAVVSIIVVCQSPASARMTCSINVDMKYIKPPISRIKDETGALHPPSPMPQLHTETMLAGQDIYNQSGFVE